jgi:hypothetical protein
MSAFSNDRSMISGLKDLGAVQYSSSNEIKKSRISIGFEALDRFMFNPEKCYELVAKTGVKWARCQTGWSRCETEKGIYDFQWLDDVVDNLLKRGIYPWFNVGYGNKIYMPDAPHESAVGCVPLYYGKEAEQAWCNYVTALAKHFSGRVKHYEIWNECNGDAFWQPQKASAIEYTKLVELTSELIRKEIPDVLIIACIFGVDIPFIRKSLESGIGEFINYYSIHPYCNVPEIQYKTQVDYIRSILSQFAPHVKLWQGECGCPSQTSGHHDTWMGLFNMDEKKQAKWLLRRLLTDLALDFALVSYFHIADLMESEYRQASGKVRPPVMMGILNGNSYTPKIAYNTFRGVCSLFGDNTSVATLYTHSFFNESTRFESKLPEVSLTTYSFIRNGYPMFVYYLPENIQLETSVNYSFSLNFFDETENNITEPVLVDLVQGRVFELPPIQHFGDVRDTQPIPLADYPLIVTDRKAIFPESASGSAVRS